MDLADRKQAPVLAHRVAIGHSGDVVGNGTRLIGFSHQLVLGWEQSGIVHEGFEEILDDAPGLVGHPQNLIVVVQIVPQEGFQNP